MGHFIKRLMTVDNPYQILGVEPTAEEAVIDANYRSLLKEHHPDHGGNEERFKKIKNAYEQIQDDQGGSTDESSSKAGKNIFDLFNTPTSTETVTGSISDDLWLEGDNLTVSLLNIARRDITDYSIDSDYTPSSSSNEDRLLVFLHVRNTSDWIQKIKPTEVRVVGTDSRTYDSELSGLGMNNVVDTEQKSLPTHLHASSREMEPHTKANFVCSIENMPDSVEIDRVIYTFKLFDGHQIDGVVQSKTRFEFDIQPKHWKQFELIASGKMESIPELVDDTDSEPSDIHEDRRSGRVDESESQSKVDSTENEALSEFDVDRLSDIVELQPTSNSELQNSWNMESGSEVYQYLSQNLDDFYERNDENKIVANRSTESFIQSLQEDL
jgi:hypothetical protein